MSQVISFKCPSCGGYLVFDPVKQRFQCPYCGGSFAENELKEQSEQRQQAAEQARSAEPNSELRSYHCQMCGAEIVTDTTTAATRCYYCHSPIVLNDRLTDEFRPDGVIPFKLDKKAAEAEFKSFISKKRFVQPDFFSQAQMEDFSGVYYPYWSCDISGEGSFDGEGTNVSIRNGAKETVTITRIFAVHREGRLTFRQMIRKALTKADGKLSDGIHPYQMEDVKPYESGYLSGFLAEKRDIEQDAAKQSMVTEAKGYAERMFTSVENPYNTLTGRAKFEPDSVKTKYLLLPAWVLTYKHRADGEPYYYMMNGQTGRICGKLPINKGKLYAVGALIGGIVFGLLCLGGAILW